MVANKSRDVLAPLLRLILHMYMSTELVSGRGSGGYGGLHVGLRVPALVQSALKTNVLEKRTFLFSATGALASVGK